MTTRPSFSSRPVLNPNPNSKFLSPMLQPYLEQQQQQYHLGLPETDEDDDDDRDHDRPQNPSIPNVRPPAAVNSNSNVNSNNSMDRSPSVLLHVSFNQDSACFAAGTDRGFRIYNCDPFGELFRRDFDLPGGIRTVEMLFRCNLLALVGGRDNPQYSLNKLMIWDDPQSRCFGELSFRSEVRGVRLRKDRIVVVLEQKIFLYNFLDLKFLNQIETIANPKGLCAVSQDAGSFVLVCPGLQKGQVRVEHYTSRKTKFILAHDSRIACFTLSRDGQWLATASSKGTLVRIFNTQDGTLLQEVRRGADRADIYSLSFSCPAQWLAVSSDKGTVHVFSLKTNLGSAGSENLSCQPESDLTRTTSGSSLAFMKGVLPKYFSSEWSVAQFHLPEGAQYVVSFGHQKNTVVILGLDGSFYRCKFDPVTGGEMTQLEYHNFLKPED